MSKNADNTTASAELDLLRQGLAARGDVGDETLEALALAAREASLSPVEYLVSEGSLTRELARTLQAIRKGYMRVPLGPLLANLQLPTTLAVTVVPPTPAQEPKFDSLLGPIPEWNSIEDDPAQADKQSKSSNRVKPVPQPKIDPLALTRAPKPGERIDTYTLRELVSASKTSIIYRAYDERERQSVQVKLLQSDVSRRERERFLNETKVLSGLTHPNILRLVSSGEYRQTPFIVYENVFSIGLDEHLGGAEHEEADFILKVAITASRGLRAAADAGIVHRDIKPANLFLYAPDGRVKVTNFGLSSDPSMGPEGTSTLRGTPDYMAPELVVASHPIDHRADMYSLGVTLYEAATGQLPFIKSTLLETMRAHVYDSLPPLLELRPTFPRGFAAIIERLLSKRPDDRFLDWAELVATFEAVRCTSENPISEAVTRAVQGDSGPASLASIYRKNNS